MLPTETQAVFEAKLHPVHWIFIHLAGFIPSLRIRTILFTNALWKPKEDGFTENSKTLTKFRASDQT